MNDMNDNLSKPNFINVLKNNSTKVGICLQFKPLYEIINYSPQILEFIEKCEVENRILSDSDYLDNQLSLSTSPSIYRVYINSTYIKECIQLLEKLLKFLKDIIDEDSIYMKCMIEIPKKFDLIKLLLFSNNFNEVYSLFGDSSKIKLTNNLKEIKESTYQIDSTYKEFSDKLLEFNLEDNNIRFDVDENVIVYNLLKNNPLDLKKVSFEIARLIEIVNVSSVHSEKIDQYRYLLTKSILLIT